MDTSPKNQAALLPNAPKTSPSVDARPIVTLFEFARGSDRFRCELVDDGAIGVEIRFYQNEKFLSSRRLVNRKIAEQWAELERDVLLRKAPEIAP